MKKSKVRFLALMLALCLLVSVFPMPTLALDNYDNDLEENLLAGNENCSIDQSIDTNSNDTGNSSQANVSQESYSEDDYSNDVNSIIDSVPAENIEEKSDLPQVCNQEDEIEIFSGSGAEVSTGHQLSKLYFKNSFTSESSFYEMQPAFDPETKEHNVIIPDSVHPSQNFAIWATLAETASGDITVQYVKSDGKQSPEIQITSGDEYGTSIPKPFKQNSLIGNSLTFKVGGEEAYIVNIIRKATLKGLTLSDQTGTEIELSPTFDGSTYSYSAEIPSDAVLSVTATATAMVALTV